MDWALHKIELNNFKFFYDSFSFPLDGKHILLYGEETGIVSQEMSHTLKFHLNQLFQEAFMLGKGWCI